MLSRKHNASIKIYPGATSEKIIEKVDGLVKNERDRRLLHTETNDITNGINTLNLVKKIVKKVKKTSSNTCIALPRIILRKDKKDFEKRVTDVYNRSRKYRGQKGITSLETILVL